MNDEQQQTANDINALQRVQGLPRDMALMKMENESMMAMAVAHPRDHEQIKRDILAQIEAYPSFARSCIYNKPVGKDSEGRMKYARGLSIRAAEALAEAYGFNRIRVDVTPLGDDAVKIEASFSDLQRNRVWQDAGIVSKYYRSSRGQMVKYADDRFYNVIVKAESSRRLREVICRSVPPGLRAELEELAERKIDELLDDKTMEKIVSNFANLNVTLEMLEKRVGKSRKAGWTKADRKELAGLWQALSDEETTVSEAFGDLKEPAEQLVNGGDAGGAKESDLTSPKEAADPTAEKAPESPSKATKGKAAKDTKKAGKPKEAASHGGQPGDSEGAAAERGIFMDEYVKYLAGLSTAREIEQARVNARMTITKEAMMFGTPREVELLEVAVDDLCEKRKAEAKS